MRHSWFAAPLPLLLLAGLLGPAGLQSGDPPRPPLPGAAVLVPAEERDRWLEERRGLVDLASPRLGGRVLRATPDGWEPAPELHDGELAGAEPERMLRLLVELPWEGGAEAAALGLAASRGLARVLVEGAAGKGEFAHLASWTGGEEEGGLLVLPLPPGKSSRLRLRIESGEGVDLWELWVWERPYSDPSGSILSTGGVDIARLANGGVAFFSGTTGGPYGHLLDGSGETRCVLPASEEEGLVLAFAAGEEALVAGVAVTLTPPEEGEAGPRTLVVAAGERDPFGVYRRLGEWPLAKGPGRQTFAFPAPARARFLKVWFPAPGGPVRATELSVLEGSAPGYASVLLRARPLAGQPEEPPRSAGLPEAAGAAPEEEPDEEPGRARLLGEGLWLAGRLSGPADRDHFRLKLEDTAGQVAVLELRMAPFLRGRAALLDAAGRVVGEPDLGGRKGAAARVPLDFPPGDYLLRLEPAPVYVLLGFDASGSMGSTFETTREALERLAAALGPGLQAGLADSAEEAERSWRLVHGFTADPSAFRAAVPRLFLEGGSSDWYTVLADLLAHGREAVPGGAAGALVYLADGNGGGDFGRMWAGLRASRLRLYTIGFGEVGQEVDWDRGWDGARGLFNVAWYRGGRYFQPKTVEELLGVYQAIFAELAGEPAYAIRLGREPRGEGRVGSEPPPGDGRPLLFILDCSGSMMAPAGETTRFAAAREVVAKVVRSLPPGSLVGLRVYGHRHRAVDAERAAEDSELIVPVGPLDPAALLGAVARLKAVGGTPLAFSLEAAAEDLAGLERPRVVLITDGMESFRRDPAAAARALARATPGLDLAVVGFAIGAEGERSGLARIAAAAGGRYADAANADALAASLAEALAPAVPYVLFDARGREAARGRLGCRHTLPAGLYTAVFPGEVRVPLEVVAGEEVRLPPPAGARGG